jgi:hypothetical protein
MLIYHGTTGGSTSGAFLAELLVSAGPAWLKHARRMLDNRSSVQVYSPNQATKEKSSKGC